MTAELLLGLLLATSPTAAPPLEGWHGDPGEALAEAAASDRIVLVDLYAEWCGWCKVLEDEVFTSDAFGELAEDLVLLRVDVEDGGPGSELQAEYGVRSLPTTLLLDAAGAQVGAIAGYAPAPEYLASIRGALKSWDDLLAAADLALAGTDLERIRALADELYDRREGRRSAALYDRILELREDVPGRPHFEYRAADAHRMAGDFDAAQERLKRARKGPGLDAGLRENLDLLAFRIARDRRQCDEAKASLEQFLRDHPRSERADQAQRTLTLLRRGDGEVCA